MGEDGAHSSYAASVTFLKALKQFANLAGHGEFLHVTDLGRVDYFFEGIHENAVSAGTFV
jgi:hypothetical protein